MEKLGNVFTLIRNGASIKQADGSGGYPVTRIETIANREIDRNKFGYAGINDLGKYRDYLLTDGDILMSHINSEKHLGKVALYHPLRNEHVIHGMNLLILRVDAQLLIPAYAFYFFNSNAFLRQIPNITKKSVNQASFTVTALKELEIPLPPLDEQRHIAAILDKVSRLISLRKKQLQKLDELIKARFVEMFGDLAAPTCKWKQVKLVDACADSDDIKCGPFGTQLSKDEYQSSGVAVWEIPQINSCFSTLPTHFLAKEKAQQLNAYSIRPGDIAMSRKGNVGKCAVFPSQFESGIIHSDVLRIRVDDSRVLPIFMMHQLHYSGAVQHQIELVSSGAIMAGINVSKLKQIFVHIPPLSLQKQFAVFVAQTDKSKAVVQKALDEAQTLFDSLMQEYFG